MDLPPGQAVDDLFEVQRCLHGEPASLAGLRDRYNGTLRAILQVRGASQIEADDILADLWGDCVASSDDKPVLLEKYSGKCILQSWLATVATNRWYDKKRRDGRVVIQTDGQSEKLAGYNLDTPNIRTEEAIVELLRDSLEPAFAACSPETKVCLRLVYIHGLSQREISRMLGWNESGVSRTLNGAMKQIATDTLREVKKRDPLLVLTWEDFLELCQTSQVGFL